MSSVVEGFEKTGYAIRSNGQPMPCQFIRMDDEGRAEVKAPNGKLYSFAPDAMATITEVEELLQRDRVLEVATSYRFAEVPNMPARTVVCSHPTRKASRYVITEGAGGLHCTCISFAKSFGTCKHIEGLQAKERTAEELAVLKAKRESDADIALGAVQAEVKRRVEERDWNGRVTVSHEWPVW